MLNKPIKEKAISLPFAIDDYGNVMTSTSQSKIWGDKVRSVIGTIAGERIMRPSFGTTIPKLAWDTTDVTVSSLDREIRSAFNSQLSQLTLDDVDIVFDEYNNLITVNVVYGLPNDERDNQVVGIAFIPAVGNVREENL